MVVAELVDNTTLVCSDVIDVSKINRCTATFNLHISLTVHTITLTCHTFVSKTQSL